MAIPIMLLGGYVKNYISNDIVGLFTDCIYAPRNRITQNAVTTIPFVVWYEESAFGLGVVDFVKNGNAYSMFASQEPFETDNRHVFRYSVENNTWTKLSALNKPRPYGNPSTFLGKGATPNGRVFIAIKGKNGSNQDVYCIYEFTDNEDWELVVEVLGNERLDFNVGKTIGNMPSTISISAESITNVLPQRISARFGSEYPNLSLDGFYVNRGNNIFYFRDCDYTENSLAMAISSEYGLKTSYRD